MNIVPLLSKKGFFARYYGGLELYDSLDARPGSPVNPIIFAICFCFQVSLYCFKKMQQRKISSSLVNKKPPGSFIKKIQMIFFSSKTITSANSPPLSTLA